MTPDKRIKTWFFQQVLEEGTVEVDASVADTIRRLDELELTPSSTDRESGSLYCVCNSKGRIMLGRESRRADTDYRLAQKGASTLHYLQGQVYEEAGRTRVYYRVVFDKGRRAYMYLAVAGLALVAAVGGVLAGYSLLSGAKVSTHEDVKFLALVGFAILLTLSLLFGKKKKLSPTEAPPQLKEFLLARLQAVERWND